MRTLLILAGLAQLALVAGSFVIPRVLGWREETAKLRPLTRQVFWTYAGYILTAHLIFGLASALAPDLLLEGTPLARGVAGFIALWWGARLVIQFAWFDTASERPPGLRFIVAEKALVLLFVGCTALYATIAALGPAAAGALD